MCLFYWLVFECFPCLSSEADCWFARCLLCSLANGLARCIQEISQLFLCSAPSYSITSIILYHNLSSFVFIYHHASPSANLSRLQSIAVAGCATDVCNCKCILGAHTHSLISLLMSNRRAWDHVPNSCKHHTCLIFFGGVRTDRCGWAVIIPPTFPTIGNVWNMFKMPKKIARNKVSGAMKTRETLHMKHCSAGAALLGAEHLEKSGGNAEEVRQRLSRACPYSPYIEDHGNIMKHI